MGIGKNLIQKMRSLYVNKPNIKAITLDVIDYNKAAINFYYKLGFKCMKVKYDHYHLIEKYYNALYLVKYLEEDLEP